MRSLLAASIALLFSSVAAADRTLPETGSGSFWLARCARRLERAAAAATVDDPSFAAGKLDVVHPIAAPSETDYLQWSLSPPKQIESARFMVRVGRGVLPLVWRSLEEPAPAIAVFDRHLVPAVAACRADLGE